MNAAEILEKAADGIEQRGGRCIASLSDLSGRQCIVMSIASAAGVDETTVGLRTTALGNFNAPTGSAERDAQVALEWHLLGAGDVVIPGSLSLCACNNDRDNSDAEIIAAMRACAASLRAAQRVEEPVLV